MARAFATDQPNRLWLAAGKGIRATVDGRAILIGNQPLLADTGMETSALEERAYRLAEEGKTPMLIAVDGMSASSPRPTPSRKTRAPPLRPSEAWGLRS